MEDTTANRYKMELTSLQKVEKWIILLL